MSADYYSPEKCAVIWGGMVAVTVAFMVPAAVISNHYNDTEVKRANACTAERGTYLEGRCTWSGEVAR